MRHLVRLVFILILLAGVSVLGYATWGDLSAERARTEIPVTLPQN
jgi:hypothetical protein